MGSPVERLRLDALKLSHHGSANATTKDLLDTIDCSHYLVPTDGSIFYHPDREAIARVIVHGGPTRRCTSTTATTSTASGTNDGVADRYGYTTVYPDDDAGLRVSL